ncbi:MAG: PIN domain-containing protein [Acidobacteriota bacterium]|nr:PIN domain-containing protein [Acidobacteriota bacterium]
MRVLFDTNVVLDFLLNRQPYAVDAAVLFCHVEAGEITGYLGATTLTTIYYLAAKSLGAGQAAGLVKKLMGIFEIAPVNRVVLESALDLRFADFEDAVLHEASRQIGAQAIVTRDLTDFRRAMVAIYTPAELTKVLVLRTDSP